MWNWDQACSPWWLAARDRPTILNGDVSVELNSPYAQFWDTLTTFGWREYLTNRRPVSFGLDDFDRFPKGTGMFLAPREVWIEAYADSGLDEAPPGAVVSDDTRLLRALAAKHRIWLHPEFEGSTSRRAHPSRSSCRTPGTGARPSSTATGSHRPWSDARPGPSRSLRLSRCSPERLVSRRSPVAAAGLVAAAAFVPSVAVAAMAVAGGKPPRQAVVSATRRARVRARVRHWSRSGVQQPSPGWAIVGGAPRRSTEGS